MSVVVENYLDLCNKHRGFIVLFRIGEFFEILFEDAVTVSKILGIHLTSRGKYNGNAVALCGFPAKSLPIYLSRLISANRRVIITSEVKEQDTGGSGIVRVVSEIVTPATIIGNFENDDSADSRYVTCAMRCDDKIMMCYLDVSVQELGFKIVNVQDWELEMKLLRPKEIITPYISSSRIVLNDDLHKDGSGSRNDSKDVWRIMTEMLMGVVGTCGQSKVCTGDADDERASSLPVFCDSLEVPSGDIFSYVPDVGNIRNAFAMFCENDYKSRVPVSCWYCLIYLLSYINYVSPFIKIQPTLGKGAAKCVLDKGALQVIDPNNDLGLYSLFGYLNSTITPIGQRSLVNAISNLAMDADLVSKRLNAVEYLCNNSAIRDDIKGVLVDIKDLKRISIRIVNNKHKKQDYLSLLFGLEAYICLIRILRRVGCERLWQCVSCLQDEHSFLSICSLAEVLSKAVNRALPTDLNDEVCLILSTKHYLALGRHYDQYQDLKQQVGVNELKYKQRFGKSTRIQYRLGVGYVIEISKLDVVPDGFDLVEVKAKGCKTILRSTVLDKLRFDIHLAKERITKMQSQLLSDLLSEVDKASGAIQQSADVIGEIDMVLSFTTIALRDKLCRPCFDDACCDDNEVLIRNLRHPVLVKKYDKAVIGNDIVFDKDCNAIVVMGPNMSGKSTFLRQYVFVQVMAQMGCFVAADSCKLFLVDRICTRIGSGDDIYNERSTFFNEMGELSSMVNNATSRSLCIIDEIGRGTTYHEGIAIAAAALRELSVRNKAMVLFATHYHDLPVHLSGLQSVVFYHVIADEVGDDILFTYKLERGVPVRCLSYGLAVARKAGVPNALIQDAKSIVDSIITN